MTQQFSNSCLMQEEQRNDESGLRNPYKVKTQDVALVRISSEKNVGLQYVIVVITYVFGTANSAHVARYWWSKVYSDYGNSGNRNRIVRDTAKTVKEERTSGDESDFRLALLGKRLQSRGFLKLSCWLIHSCASAHTSSCKDAMKCYESTFSFKVGIGYKKNGRLAAPEM
jgi:hypothetical protein